MTDNIVAFTGKNDYLINLLKSKISKVSKIESNIEIIIKQKNFLSAKYVSGLIANMTTNGGCLGELYWENLHAVLWTPLRYKIKWNGRLNNSDKHKSFKTFYGKVFTNTIN